MSQSASLASALSLLCLGAAGAAADAPPGLLGVWNQVGIIDVASHAVAPAPSQVTFDFRSDLAIIHNGGGGWSAMLYDVNPGDGHGLVLKATFGTGRGSPVAMRVVPTGEGIALFLDGQPAGYFLKRSDGHPPALPAAAWPDAPVPVRAGAAPIPGPVPASGTAVTAASFTSKAKTLAFDRSIELNDEGGQAVTLRDGAQLTVVTTYDEHIAVTASDLSLDEAVTDGGESLRGPVVGLLHGAKDRLVRASSSFSSGRGWSTIELAPPQKPAKEIARLRGTLKVTYESTPRAPIDLAPARAQVGKRQSIGEHALGLTVTSIAGAVEISCDAALDAEIKAIEFLDGHGQAISSHGSGTSSDGTKTERTYHVQLADDATIRILLVGGTAQVLVPLLFEHLPLIAPKPPGTGDANDF